MPSFIIVGRFIILADFPKRPVLNRVNAATFLDNNWKSFSSSSLIPFSTKICSDVPFSSLGEYLESFGG